MTKTTLFGTAVIALFLVLQSTALPSVADEQWLSAEEDYITCSKQPCVFAAGSEWSEKNPSGVAVAVAFGAEPAVTDDQIKTILTQDLQTHGVESIKFFFEQNDAPASGIAFHVRGGTEGVFLISTVRAEVADIARRAKNTNPVLR